MKVPILGSLLGGSASDGATARAKMAWKTTPWSWRTTDGIYIGYNSRDAWMYRELQLSPLEWEDNDRQLAVGRPLASLLDDLAQTSKDLGAGLRTLTITREIHLLSVSWDAPPSPDPETPQALAEYLKHSLTFLVPRRALLIGIKLRASAVGPAQAGTLPSQLKRVVTQVLGEDTPDLEIFERDIARINEMCGRHEARVPPAEVLAQLESWYNLGRGPDVFIREAKDLLFVDDFDVVELSAVMRFDDPVLHAPDAPWALTAATHPNGPSVISIRGSLEPTSIARARLRRGQRVMLSQLEEQSHTSDLARDEDSDKLSFGREAENYFVQGRQPLISDCSIVMARHARTTDGDMGDTYLDSLRMDYGIVMKPLEHRQLAALAETLPCGQTRVNPFLQDVSVSMLAHAGLQGFSALGDRKGFYVGLVDPDYTPCWVDPYGAQNADLPAAMGVFGDSGSGKTFLLQMLATQGALNGTRTFFINPKAYESLSPMADLVGGETISISQLEHEGGFFDPFRFAVPTVAAEIATDHIMGVLGGAFTQQEAVQLAYALKRGALAGARCVGEALENVPEAMRTLILQQAEASALFSLGISLTPKPSLRDLGTGTAPLTLVEFDRPLDLPAPGATPSREQGIALQAVRLVARAALEILNASDGGIFILDEAWVFLTSAQSLTVLQRLGREGRSRNILPILATQRVDDLLRQGVALEGVLSRVFVLKLNEAADAAAALKLCGLEPTPARIAWIKNIGPRRATDTTPARGAIALHRDLANRHAAVLIGPVPEAARVAFSTNPLDRKERERQAALDEAAASATESGAGVTSA